MSKSHTPPPDDRPTSRRRFLATAGLAGAGAVAVPLLGGDEAAAVDPPQGEAAGRYALNDHVKRFYFLNSL